MSRASPLVVLDVDTGVDDAMAIMLARSLGARILAITCVAGNTDLERAYNNTLRVLGLVEETRVPVYRGNAFPLSGTLNTEPAYFDQDGFGGASEDYPVGANPAGNFSEHASIQLVRMVRQIPGQITLILLGPATNAALAMMLDEGFTENLKAIVILGGNYKGQGNIQPGTSFNFYVDPEAAGVVLSRARCPITVVPWETVRESPLPWDIYERLIQGMSREAHFFADTTQNSVSCCKENDEGYVVGDPLAVLAVLVPDAVTSSYVARVSVELAGRFTRGQMVQAWKESQLPGVSRNVTIATKFSESALTEAFEKMLE